MTEPTPAHREAAEAILRQRTETLYVCPWCGDGGHWSAIGDNEIRCNRCERVSKRAKWSSGRVEGRREWLRDGIAEALASAEAAGVAAGWEASATLSDSDAQVPASAAVPAADPEPRIYAFPLLARECLPLSARVEAAIVARLREYLSMDHAVSRTACSLLGVNAPVYCAALLQEVWALRDRLDAARGQGAPEPVAYRIVCRADACDEDGVYAHDEYEGNPSTHDVAMLDQRVPGCGPHRVLPLYAHPSAAAPAPEPSIAEGARCTACADLPLPCLQSHAGRMLVLTASAPAPVAAGHQRWQVACVDGVKGTKWTVERLALDSAHRMDTSCQRCKGPHVVEPTYAAPPPAGAAEAAPKDWVSEQMRDPEMQQEVLRQAGQNEQRAEAAEAERDRLRAWLAGIAQESECVPGHHAEPCPRCDAGSALDGDEPPPGYLAALAALAAPAPRGDEGRCLGDVLAVLCGDGGHYLRDHGAEKAKEYALKRFYALLARAEAAEQQAKARRDALIEVRRVIEADEEAITDTIWQSESENMTLVDYIDGALGEKEH